MKRVQQFLALISLFSFAPGAFAQWISDLPEDELNPSGRLRIHGTGFGFQGQVMVDGRPAIVTTWGDTAIHAYVPEDTSLGNVSVQVLAVSGASNVASLQVTPRVVSGRTLWRFQGDAHRLNPHQAAIGLDGTIYIDDIWGRLYAIRPNGALAWVYDGNSGMPGVGAEGPVCVMADGTIVFASNPGGLEVRIHAVHPNGTRKWMWSHFSPAYRFCAGPGVGPDGNIYAVLDRAQAGSIGAFSLDPSGNLRWSNQGSPLINDHGSLGHRIDFSDDAFFVAFDEAQVPGVNGHWMFAFGLDGTQRYSLEGCARVGRPQVRPDHSILMQWGGNYQIRSLEEDGTTQWTLTTGGNNAWPVLDSTGNAFLFRPVQRLQSLDPGGTERWSVTGAMLGWPNFLGVSPDNSVLFDGGRMNFGEPGWLRGYDAGDGALLWDVSLPEERVGATWGDLVVSGEPTFAADSSRVYAPVEVLALNNSNPYSYLYAVALQNPPLERFCSPGNTNSSGSPAELIGVLGAGPGSSLHFEAQGGPPSQFGYLLVGTGSETANPISLGAGLLCLSTQSGQALGRYNIAGSAMNSLGQFDGNGLLQNLANTSVTGSGFDVPVELPFGGGTIVGGSTWHFQLWYRDTAQGAGTSNLTNGVTVRF